MTGLRNKLAICAGLTLLSSGGALLVQLKGPQSAQASGAIPGTIESQDGPQSSAASSSEEVDPECLVEEQAGDLGLMAPDVQRALSLALIGLSALPALFLLLRIAPSLSRDARRLRAALQALAANEEVEAMRMVHREFAECVREVRRAAQKIKIEQGALQENAFRDALTGLPNRRPFMDILTREASAAIRNRRPLSLVMADLDHFKTLNDTYGHQLGDRVLKHVAGRFSNLVRQSDMVARFGGEELSILLPGTDLDTAMEIAQQLRNALRSDPIVLEGEQLHVSASFGVAEMLRCRLSDSDHLLHQADMALYEAKRQGRDRVVAAASMGDLDDTATSTETASERTARPSQKPVKEKTLGQATLDQDTLALMGCTFSVLQVMPDRHRVMRDMIQQVATVLQCERVSMFLVDEAGGRLVPAVALGVSDFHKTEPIPFPDDLRESLSVSASSAQAPLEGVRGPVLIASGQGEQARTVIYLPVAEYDDVFGVIKAADLPKGVEISARQRTILDAICAIGASALKSCDVYSRLEKHWLGSIEALCAAIIPPEKGKPDHLAQISALCLEIARRLGREDREELQLLQIAAYLYDIGKVGVPKEILEKRGRLRASELALMRDHCRLGAAIVRSLPGLEGLARVVLHHHERFDGSGYPEGLSGEGIPLESRIIAVVDAFAAMTSDRPYRRALSPRKAIETLMEGSGTQFDPLVVAAFLKTKKARSFLESPIPVEGPPHRVPESAGAV